MKPLGKLGSLTLALLAVACTDQHALGPDVDLTDPELGRSGTRGAQEIRFLSQNLYIGADVDVVIEALVSGDPNQIGQALNTAIQTLMQTDYPARAAAVADQVARFRPDVIGLQEVYELTVNIPDLNINVSLPFLDILQAELAARGLSYVKAADVVDTDTGNSLPGITLVDHDVILVNPDRVGVAEAQGQLFSANLGDVGVGFELVRGWTRIRAEIAGRELEIWNTHLESGSDPLIAGLRALQTEELVGLASTEVPVVMMGDFNDTPDSDMHSVMTAVGGFHDVWAELRPGSRGYTCCHLPDLSNMINGFDHRIDYFFSRGISHPRNGLQGSIDILGDTPSDRLDGPYYRIWPSDHGGLAVTFLLPPAVGLTN